jgi:hypothetical protein
VNTTSTLGRAAHAVLRASTLSLTLVSLSLTGCGDDASGDGDDGGNQSAGDPCQLTVELSGGHTESLSYDVKAGCSGSSSADATSLSWGGFSDEHPTNFTLFIDAATTAPGTGLPATVNITAGSNSWSTPDGVCTVDLSTATKGETDDFGTDYDLAGTGSCTGPAVDSSGTAADVTIGPVSFKGGTLLPN